MYCAICLITLYVPVLVVMGVELSKFISIPKMPNLGIMEYIGHCKCLACENGNSKCD